MTFVPGTGGRRWWILNYDSKLWRHTVLRTIVFVIDGDKMEHLDGIKRCQNLVPLNGHRMC